MASISTDSGGKGRILFCAPDGKRKVIRLGKVPMKTATSIRTRVENMLAAMLGKHAIDGDTAAWVGSLDARMAHKLAAVGLVPRREPTPDEAQPEGATLAGFIKQYIAARPGMKPNTLKKLWADGAVPCGLLRRGPAADRHCPRRLRRLKGPPGSQGARPGDHRPQREAGAAVPPRGGPQAAA